MTTLALHPTQPWVLVEPSFEKEKKEINSLIALPEDYKPSETPYKVVSVIRDPSSTYRPYDAVVVPTNMLIDITIHERKYYMIQLNYIMATVKAE